MREPESELESLRQEHLYRDLRRIESVQGSKVTIQGKQLLQFASNDYLGLANSPALKAFFQEAVDRYGVGAGASRLITGTHQSHTDLEEELADFKRTERALTFSTGYATAVGTLTSLLGKDDYVILDKLCHACLIDGARMSGATIRVFPHNDLRKLDSHLHWARSRAQAHSRILVITESVFSMDGDESDLREIVRLKSHYDGLLLVDEAHAVGLRGPEGRGLADELGIADQVDLQMGTLSKAVGVSGGYICASAPWIELLINRARSLIYSTAPPPAVAATAQKSIQIIRGPEGDDLRTKLQANIETFTGAVGGSKNHRSPICPIHVGDSERALALSQKLQDAGMLVPAIRFPTVPRKTERLRVSLSALHEFGEITSLSDFLRAALGPNSGEQEASG